MYETPHISPIDDMFTEPLTYITNRWYVYWTPSLISAIDDLCMSPSLISEIDDLCTVPLIDD